MTRSQRLRFAALWPLAPFVLLVSALAASGCGSGATNDGPTVKCNSCHGSEDNPAPPRATNDDTETTSVRVGAHQTHLHDSEVRQAMWCQECHVVPTTINEPTHQDGSPAELTFGILATTGETDPSWDRDEEKCSNVYCHGATLAGGTNTEPKWTAVDGSQAFCGSCHGIPPLAPHPPNFDCAQCHPETMDDDGGIDLATQTHINGKVDVIELTCSTCHGSEDNFAPPLSIAGESDTSLVTIGAHQSHLADGKLRRAIECEECHIVPAAFGDAGHADSASPAELTFGTLATTDGASPKWDRVAATCSGVYCHGATLDGGTNTAPKWTELSGSETVCGSCHGLPPGDGHDPSDKCVDCHAETVAANLVLDLDKHMDGKVQYTSAKVNNAASSSLPQTSATKLVCE